MRYFAMIGGERRGPYTLDQLAEAGVTPDTYVWCKGMDDWQQAADVADICRHFRLSIFDHMHPSAKPTGITDPCQLKEGATTGSDPLADVPPSFRRMVEKSGETPGPRMPADDTPKAPAPTLLLSVLLTLFCFPVTGWIAIYFSWQARRAWEELNRSRTPREGKLYTPAERDQAARRLAEADRQARMWVGITFFLGIILMALVGHKLI